MLNFTFELFVKISSPILQFVCRIGRERERARERERERVCVCVREREWERDRERETVQHHKWPRRQGTLPEGEGPLRYASLSIFNCPLYWKCSLSFLTWTRYPNEGVNGTEPSTSVGVPCVVGFETEVSINDRTLRRCKSRNSHTMGAASFVLVPSISIHSPPTSLGTLERPLANVIKLFRAIITSLSG